MGIMTGIRAIEWDDLSERIILFEDGALTKAETLGLFQDLVDSGHAWSLPGYYGRHAMDLIEAGYITRSRIAVQ